MPQHPQVLYDYHVWANERLFTHLEQLPEEVFHAEVTSVFPSVSYTLEHMYMIEQIYLAALNEVPNEVIYAKIPSWTAEAKNRTVNEMRQLFAGVTELFLDLLQRTPDPDKAMIIMHPTHGRLDTHFSGIMEHVVNHGTYHRGNITAMLRQQGVEGVPTDYIFYLLDGQKERS